MATLTTRSTALNVWSHADAAEPEAKHARFQTNASNEFQVAYDSGDFPVRVVHLKFGAKLQTATEIVDSLALSVSTESGRAQAAEGANASDIADNATDIANETSARELAIDARVTALAGETAARESADTTFANNLSSEAATRAAAVTAENARATTAEGANATAIAAEETRALAAEGVNDAAISAEVSRAQAAEGVNASGIASEITARTQADNNLQSQIDSLDSGSSSSLAAEVARAQAAESAIDARITTLINGSPETLDQLTEIVADYEANGADITASVNAEVTRAQGEEAALKLRLDAIEALLEALQNTTTTTTSGPTTVTFTAARASTIGDTLAENGFRAAFAEGQPIYTAGNALLIGDVTSQVNLSDASLPSVFRMLRTTVTIALHSEFITAYAADNSILQPGMQLGPTDSTILGVTPYGGTEVVCA